MKRRPLLTAVMLMLAFAVADRLGTAFTAEEVARHALVLERAPMRIPVNTGQGQSKEHMAPNTARIAADAPRYFGRIMVLVTPGGERITCDHVLYWSWCNKGWDLARG